MEETHHNHITYSRFREGICELFGLDEHASDEEKDTVIETIETKWWFCGGRDTRIELDINDDEGEAASLSPKVLERWEKLWKYYFPTTPMPEAVNTCVCNKSGLRYNVFITDGKEVIIIGRICLIQFLPQQAKRMNSKRCERCMKPHKNRKDNHCRECQEQRKEEEERRFREETEQRLREQRERERERLRQLQQEAEIRARTCKCGAAKQREYPQCYFCSQKKKRQEYDMMSPQQRKAFFCSCGKSKKPQFSTCWICREAKK